MQNELVQLREENERLKIIIKALSDKLRTTENGDYSNVKENIGVKNLISSIDKDNTGVNNLISSIDKDNIGVNKSLSAIPENNIGVKNLILPDEKKNIGVKTSLAESANINIGGKSLNWTQAVSELRREIPTSSISGIENSAKILVQLHQHPRNSYKDLQKLTGLSEDGLPKRIMALKKRGLIIRTAFQQYTLTEKALKIFQKADE